MGEKKTARKLLSPKKNADKAWYLALLDGEKQMSYEKEHLAAVLQVLKAFYIVRIRDRIRAAREEIAQIRSREKYGAEDYRALQEKNAFIAAEQKKLQSYRPFFSEPYFARMDVVDVKVGYNS